jgi:hypothetical protein
MEQTNEYFTLESLGKLYTDAAKAGGIQNWNGDYWVPSIYGPNIMDCQRHFRPKQVSVVKYVIKYPDGTTSRASFKHEYEAKVFVSKFLPNSNSKIIKLIEEV